MPLDAERERLKALKGQVLQLLAEAKALEYPVKRKEADAQIERLLADIELREETVEEKKDAEKKGEEVPRNVRQLASESSINNLSERCRALEEKLDKILSTGSAAPTRLSFKLW